MQPPGGEPGSDPADPQATPSLPGADTDTSPPAMGATAGDATAPPATIPAARRGAGSAGSTGPSVRVGVADRPREPGGPGSARPVVCRHGLALRGLRPRQHHRVDHRLDHRRGPWARSIATVVSSGSASSADYTVTGGAFLVPYVVVGFAYFVFFWSGGRRATPGQQLFKLQVGNAFDGMALTSTQAVKRGSHWAPPEPVLGPACDLPVGLARRARLGDRPVRDHRRSPTKQALPRQVRQFGRGQAIGAGVECPAPDLPDHHPRPGRPVRGLESSRVIFLGSQLSTIRQRRRVVDLIQAPLPRTGVTRTGC